MMVARPPLTRVARIAEILEVGLESLIVVQRLGDDPGARLRQLVGIVLSEGVGQA